MSERSGLKESLINLVNAVSNISPSRSLLAQFMLLLPKDVKTVEQSYPEFVAQDAKKFIQEFFGIIFNENIQRDKGGFAEAVYKHIHAVFDWLDDEDTLTELSKVIDMPVSSIPNPYAEWAEAVLSKVTKLYGKRVLELLDALIKHEAYIADIHSFLKEVGSRLKFTPAELEEVKRRLVLLKDSESECVRVYGNRYWSRYEYLMHNDYHLDLIIKTLDTGYGSYSTYYGLERHKGTIRKLLNKLKA